MDSSNLKKMAEAQVSTKYAVIGKIRISHAIWRGKTVYGDFDMVKKWTPTAEAKRRATSGKPLMGVVTIWIDDTRKRVVPAKQTEKLTRKLARVRVHWNYFEVLA